ncbi:hypothetical protein TSUD_214810 [Trifolium subterraneum]|uniref:Integrase catalytic domain-containing protein n=1 Tax=Trifolium subterraneum TaxID=3900 RepID=A0A2Z6N4W8_TRISU|nr:hypothetical protein TSUD_214810 [Trifolium subterraneum]
MAESSYMQPSIPKFDGHYDHWAMLMENLLRSKEFWSLIENSVTVAPVNATAEQQQIANESKPKDLKAKNFLFQAIDRTILETILNRETSRDIWESMRQKYQGSNKVKRAQLQALRKEFEMLHMKDNESVDAFFSRTLAITSKMTAHGETMTQTIVVEKVLRSMSSRFNYVVCSIEEAHDATTLTIDELQASLLVHERRMQPLHDRDEEQALKISSINRGRGRGRMGGRSGGRGSGRQTNYAEYDKNQEVLLMTQATDRNNDNSRLEMWFLDSGCSNHMVGRKDWLFDFDDSFREMVKLGDNSKMPVMGKGNLKLCIGGIIQVITEVYYLPGLQNSLLSIGQLQQKNLTIVVSNDLCKVYHESRGLIMSTQMTTNRIYGHLSHKGLSILTKKEMVKGLPVLQETTETCEDCIIGKHQRDSIPMSANWRATEELQLVHSDICGPINPTSNGGSRYFITFTDDFSRKTWTYVLTEKSNALTIFKKFKAITENESNCKLKCLRTDRGGEFTSTEFNDFCSEHGIKRQLTTAYTPQQNGVSERKNRTIMNMVRSMIAEKGVPKRFWPEEVLWATLILNRSPTLSDKEMTPEEAWNDPKSVKCVHLGISDESKAYKLYDPVSKKIIISRDVIFDETKGWDWNEKPTKQRISIEDHAESSATVSETDSEWQEPTQADGVNVTNEVINDHVSDTESSENDEDVVTNLGPRVRRPPAWTRDFVTNLEHQEDEELQNLVMFSNESDPRTYEEAAKFEVWRKTMDQEIESIEKNDTWELTDLPNGSKKIGVKWIYKTKYNESGKVEKYKARLVAKGYSQQHGIDYNEVFAPVARWDTIRTVLALLASKGWNVYQLDVKSAFLHGELIENVYIEQPLGYQKEGKNKVYKLRKALYGLKQAPRAWYSKIETYFAQAKFTKCPYEPTLFVKQDTEGRMLIVSLYVDDLIYTRNDEKMFNDFKKSMKSKFAMTDLGKMRYFLGVEVKQADNGILVYQQKYAQDILSTFGMEICNTVCSLIVPGNKLIKDEGGKLVDATEYRQMIGSLMYLLATRPDLTFSVCLIARYMERPTKLHLAAAKRVLRYLKGTIGLGIWYKNVSKDVKLEGWTDSDYAGDMDDRKNTSGYVFSYASGPISWSSKKQPIVTLSTTEAEFVVAASCACQAVWLRRVLEQIGESQVNGTAIFCDNSSSIKLSKNPVMYGRCKHIDVRYHFLRDLTKEGVVELKHCSTQEQLADIMTKALKLDNFCKLREDLSMCDVADVV